MIVLDWRQLMYATSFVLLGLLFLQCQTPEVRSLEARTFFDLKGFMDQEKERLGGGKIPFEKKITLNGKTETQIITAADFKVEFSEFYASDINRLAWLDKYAERKDGQGLHYEAKDDQLEVREMDIDTKNGITTIRIKKKSENMLNNSEKELFYQSDKGYQMNSIRKSIGESADTLEIRVRYMGE